MAAEPTVKRTCVFVDGQNLYHAAKDAFGYRYPNYNIQKLANEVCTRHGWRLVRTHFYTGIPDTTDNAFWNHLSLSSSARTRICPKSPTRFVRFLGNRTGG